jgi:type VI secretion system protein VasJ
VSQEDQQADLALTRPIPGDSPVGGPARYEPEFELIKLEIDKIAAMRAAEVEWTKVVENATEILSSKSKDLLVASYLAAGSLHVRGYAGLADGLRVVTALAQTYWDNMFPEVSRLRARVAALTWLNERAASDVAQRAASPGEADAVSACVKNVRALNDVLGEKLAAEAPSLRDMIDALEERQRELQAPAPPPAASPAPTAEAAAAPAMPAAAAAPPAAVDLSSPEGVEKAIGRALEIFRDAAPELRRSRPQDPLAYRMARLGAWGAMEDLPPNTDGKTRLQPLGASAAEIERYDALAAQGDWQALLELAESQFERSVLWLDTQRFVCAALEGLGPPYEEALRAVKSECASLARLFPGLLGLTFSNDTPLADDETRAWFRDSVLAGGDDSGTGPLVAAATTQSDDADEEFDAVLKEAAGLVKKKKLAQGTAKLAAAMDSAPSRRRRFLRRLAMAQFLHDAKEYRLAVAQLDALDSEIKAYGLDRWEPALAVRVLSLLISCHNRLLKGAWKGSAEAAARTEELFIRLAGLDAVAALGLQSK